MVVIWTEIPSSNKSINDQQAGSLYSYTRRMFRLQADRITKLVLLLGQADVGT